MAIIIKYPEILFFLILCFLYVWYKKWHSREHKNVLPTNWPLLGMLPNVLANTNRIHEYLTQIFQQDGCTFEFKGPWFTNLGMLLTCDPVNVNYILSKNFSNFSKGPEFKKIFDILGDGIFNSESESWEVQRKLSMSLFNHQRFPKFVAKTSKNKVEKGLIPVLDSVSELGTEVDLQELFARFTFDTSCILVLGHDPVSLSIDLPHIPEEKAFADAEEAVLWRHILPETVWRLQRWLQIGKEKRLSQSYETLHKFLSKCISAKHIELRNKRATQTEEDQEDLLAGYIRAFNENNDTAGYSEKFLRDILLNLVFAGKDTLAAALSWLFWLLVTNPKEEKKIREEIIKNLNDREDKNGSFFNVEELKNLIYLQAALCESLRLFPPVALQHKAPIEPDILPSGHRMNRNIKTVLSFYSMARMETIWGKDCLEFKPERWISERGGIKIMPSSKFVVFNAGPRSCLGKDMSFTQMKVVAAALIYRYNIQVVEGHPICPSGSVILHMKYGLKVRITKRCV